MSQQTGELVRMGQCKCIEKKTQRLHINISKMKKKTKTKKKHIR